MTIAERYIEEVTGLRERYGIRVLDQPMDHDTVVAYAYDWSVLAHKYYSMSWTRETEVDGIIERYSDGSAVKMDTTGEGSLTIVTSN